MPWIALCCDNSTSGLPDITNHLAIVFGLLITSHLVAVSWQLSGMAITNGLAAVNQRLMSPYFGDLAEWLCKTFGQPGQMDSSSTNCFFSGLPGSVASEPRLL